MQTQSRTWRVQTRDCLHVFACIQAAIQLFNATRHAAWKQLSVTGEWNYKSHSDDPVARKKKKRSVHSLKQQIGWILFRVNPSKSEFGNQAEDNLFIRKIDEVFKPASIFYVTSQRILIKTPQVEIRDLYSVHVALKMAHPLTARPSFFSVAWCS